MKCPNDHPHIKRYETPSGRRAGTRVPKRTKRSAAGAGTRDPVVTFVRGEASDGDGGVLVHRY